MELVDVLIALGSAIATLGLREAYAASVRKFYARWRKQRSIDIADDAKGIAALRADIDKDMLQRVTLEIVYDDGTKTTWDHNPSTSAQLEQLLELRRDEVRGLSGDVTGTS